jgi:hypothetical protein
LDLAKANEKLNVAPPALYPSWSGYIWKASFGGYWASYLGETEEAPSVILDAPTGCIKARVQSYGEGNGVLSPTDFSHVYAYLAFRLTPPSWGHLHVYVSPWFHGGYSLFADADGIMRAEAKAEIGTWVDLHQNFWRGRKDVSHLKLAGQEIHPTQAKRIDHSYAQTYYAQVAPAVPITILVGVRLYSEARAGGTHSVLDFKFGAAGYIYMPYVYWNLQH